MGQRLDLQSLLEDLTPNVYFQPPNNLKMQYPCIVYHRDNAETKFANNTPYNYTQRYKVTVIALDPDNPLPLQIAYLPMCLYDRFYTADNLNHDVFTLFF